MRPCYPFLLSGIIDHSPVSLLFVLFKSEAERKSKIPNPKPLVRLHSYTPKVFVVISLTISKVGVAGERECSER
jgi:hypothetical protein